MQIYVDVNLREIMINANYTLYYYQSQIAVAARSKA
jgi:hypothetical protein